MTRLILFSIIKINIMLFVNSESHDQPAYLFSEIQSTLFLFCCSFLLLLLGCCFLFCVVLFFCCCFVLFFLCFFTSCTVIGCNVSTNSEDSKQPCKDVCSKAKSYLHCSYIYKSKLRFPLRRSSIWFKIRYIEIIIHVSG